jgi:hypothetical protein
VFHAYTLCPWVTVKDNVMVLPNILGVPRGEDDKQAL